MLFRSKDASRESAHDFGKSIIAEMYKHATVYVRARNQTLGAMTPLSGSLFGQNCLAIRPTIAPQDRVSVIHAILMRGFRKT